MSVDADLDPKTMLAVRKKKKIFENRKDFLKTAQLLDQRWVVTSYFCNFFETFVT